MSSAQRIARAGPSKVIEAVACRVIFDALPSLKRFANEGVVTMDPSAHARSPTDAWRWVEPTMSVKRTVPRIMSGASMLRSRVTKARTVSLISARLPKGKR